MVLVLIAIFVALFAILSLGLAHFATLELRIVHQVGYNAQQVQLVESGIAAAAQAIDCLAHPNLFDNPERFSSIVVVPVDLSPPGFGAGRFTVFSARVDQDQVRGTRFGLTRESAKLSLEAILDWENEMPGQGTSALQQLPGITPEAIDSILDWLDADDIPRLHGAEADWYRGQGRQYTPRNAVPIALEELLLIRGVDREMLFGEDHLLTFGSTQSRLRTPGLQGGMMDPFAPIDFDQWEFTPATGESTVWQFLLTPYSAEKMVNSQGVVRLHLNESNLEFLESQMRLHQLDEESIQFILMWRNINGNISDPLDLLNAEIMVDEIPMPGPFAYSNPVMFERFLRLLDETVADPAIVVNGRINVNEAPRAVLQAVPGLTPELVTAILERRNPDMEQHRHAVWLLAEGIVDLEMMRTLSRRLTTGGDVYRIQVAGFFDGCPRFFRAEVVLDATVRPPRTVFYKDLTPLGFPE